jgi:hypothetical protein
MNADVFQMSATMTMNVALAVSLSVFVGARMPRSASGGVAKR